MVFAGRGDEPVTMTFTIQRVEPPTLVEHTHADAASYMRWELEPVDTGCVLRLSHFVTDPDAAISNCYVVGLRTSLARLAPCLAGRTVAWDWDGFAEAQAHYADLGLAPPVHAPCDDRAFVAHNEKGSTNVSAAPSAELLRVGGRVRRR